MRSVTARAGDTYESIAFRYFADSSRAGEIAAANPDTPTLSAGAQVTLPPLQVSTRGTSGLAINVDGRTLSAWGDFSVVRSVDSVDAVEVLTPYNPDKPADVRAFRPFSFAPVGVALDGVRLFTGTLVGVMPRSEPGRRDVQLGCYAVPGTLLDCCPAPDTPAEFTDQGLAQIARTVCAPFGVSVVFDGPAGAKFDTVALKHTVRAFDFLADLARQRGLLLGSNADGDLVFRRVGLSAPVATLSEDLAPVVSVVPTFSPQEYYSHVTGLESVVEGTDGSQYTVKNPRLAGVFRPHVFAPPLVEGGDMAAAVAAEAGRMLAGAVQYQVTLAAWRTPEGALYSPGDTVRLTAPGAMCPRPFDFLVRSVRLRSAAGQGGQTAELDLVLPGAFSGEEGPVPWSA